MATQKHGLTYTGNKQSPEVVGQIHNVLRDRLVENIVRSDESLTWVLPESVRQRGFIHVSREEKLWRLSIADGVGWLTV